MVATQKMSVIDGLVCWNPDYKPDWKQFEQVNVCVSHREIYAGGQTSVTTFTCSQSPLHDF